MRLCFAVNPHKANAALAAESFSALCLGYGVIGSIYNGTNEDALADADVLVVLGGDGSIFHNAPIAYRHGLPILGVHMGRTGFLTEITADEFAGVLPSLISGALRQTKLPFMSVMFPDGNRCLCLNDVAVYKQDHATVLRLSLACGNNCSGEWGGDGVVVATPAGSTAYSLAAGGPLLCGGVAGMVITPLCPHSMTLRPLVAPWDCETQITVAGEADVAVDGKHAGRLQAGERLSVRGTGESVTLLRFSESNIFECVRAKLQ